MSYQGNRRGTCGWIESVPSWNNEGGSFSRMSGWPLGVPAVGLNPIFSIEVPIVHLKRRIHAFLRFIGWSILVLRSLRCVIEARKMHRIIKFHTCSLWIYTHSYLTLDLGITGYLWLAFQCYFLNKCFTYFTSILGSCCYWINEYLSSTDYIIGAR